MNLSAWSPLASFRANTSNDHLSTFCAGREKDSNNATVHHRLCIYLLKWKKGNWPNKINAVQEGVCVCFSARTCASALIPWAQIWQWRGSWVPPYWRYAGTSCLDEIKTSNAERRWARTPEVTTMSWNHRVGASPPRLTNLHIHTAQCETVLERLGYRKVNASASLFLFPPHVNDLSHTSDGV